MWPICIAWGSGNDLRAASRGQVVGQSYQERVEKMEPKWTRVRV